ncbi:MAG: hypothetical protein H6741_25700 [Alphaproteobacteria bacterium]|nr:hypothetical protein [Alphaproteobacteria bacterium]MCB9796106.1 hypothetical protein [Alphaproteobacteria bacterium]
MRPSIPFGPYELRLFPLPDGGALARLGRPGDQPERVNDGFYPAEDLGYLWLRKADGHTACSGLLLEGTLDEHALLELIDQLEAEVFGEDMQVDLQVQFVRRERTILESGEESGRW